MGNFLSCCSVCDLVNSDGFPKEQNLFFWPLPEPSQLRPFPSVTSKDGFEAPLLTREGEEALVRREEEEEEERESWGGWGVYLIVSHTRVVSQTDLHSRPQGTLGSVCPSLKPKRVGGHETPATASSAFITFTLSLHLLSFLYFFHRHREKLVRDRGQHYARHLLVLHRRASTKLGLNRPKGQPEEFAPVVLIKGERFPSSPLITGHVQCSSLAIRPTKSSIS